MRACQPFRNSMEKSDSFITFKLLQITLPLVVKSWKVTENVRWQNKALLVNCWCHGSCAVESSEPKNFHARLQQSVWLLPSSLFFPPVPSQEKLKLVGIDWHCSLAVTMTLIYHFIYFPIYMWIIVSNGSLNVLA